MYKLSQKGMGAVEYPDNALHEGLSNEEWDILFYLRYVGEAKDLDIGYDLKLNESQLERGLSYLRKQGYIEGV